MRRGIARLSSVNQRSLDASLQGRAARSPLDQGVARTDVSVQRPVGALPGKSHDDPRERRRASHHQTTSRGRETSERRGTRVVAVRARTVRGGRSACRVRGWGRAGRAAGGAGGGLPRMTRRGCGSAGVAADHLPERAGALADQLGPAARRGARRQARDDSDVSERAKRGESARAVRSSPSSSRRRRARPHRPSSGRRRVCVLCCEERERGSRTTRRSTPLSSARLPLSARLARRLRLLARGGATEERGAAPPPPPAVRNAVAAGSGEHTSTHVVRFAGGAFWPTASRAAPTR